MRNGIANFKFRVETGEMTGYAGIVLNVFDRWENYIPTFGQGLGHDVIEHDGKNETGAFDEELAAHGSVLFTTEFLASEPSHPLYTPAQNLAGGMSSQFKESTVDHIRNPPKARGVSWDEARELKKFAFDYFQAMAKEWKSEAYDGDHNDKGECECEACVNPFEGREAFNRVYGWLKFGYGRAKRKYKGESWQALMLKKEIDEVSRRESDNLKEYADTGIEFTMRLDLDNTEVKIIYPRGFGYYY